MSGANPLGMSDDDFLNMNSPSEMGDAVEDEGGAITPSEDTPEEEEEPATPKVTEAEEETPETGSEEEPGNAEETGEEGGETEETSTSGETEEEGAAATPAEGEEPKKKPDTPEEKPETVEESKEEAPDYEAFYKQIMTPFKANGKMIELKDPAEAIQLMQMGANYTRKLQDIQPHRKVLLMLENNELLDEGKLSYLIDLDKKNPEAIKKLIKDAGIDPMDIDTESEPNYLEGSHKVTDEEARFTETLREVNSTESGKELVQLIQTSWDQASKEVLWSTPEVLPVLHQQRESGVFDLIAAEVDRQKTLGKIQPNTPFLEAYNAVGHEMARANGGGATAQPDATQPAAQPGRTKIAEKVATPKPKVTNGEKASAASPTQDTPKRAQKLVNPLALSDEEFLKQFEGRI